MGQLQHTTMRPVDANLEGVFNIIINFASICFKGTLSLNDGHLLMAVQCFSLLRVDFSAPATRFLSLETMTLAEL